MADTIDITETAPEYEQRIAQWTKIRDALEGEDEIRLKGVEYLPKPRGMKTIDYKNYLARAVFYGVSERTLRGIVGLVLRVQPVVLIPNALEPLRSFASPEGFTLNQLVRETLDEIMSLGRYGVLVDAPRGSAVGNVPYLATYKAEQIFAWEERVEAGTGRRILVRVKLLEEPSTEADETETLIRELFLDDGGVYRQQLWRQVEAKNQARLATSGTARPSAHAVLTGMFEKLGAPVTPLRANRPMTEIPFFFGNVYDLRAKPPFLDLGNMNLAHYRNSADFETALHLVASPTPYIFGVSKGDVPKAIGPSVIWNSPQKDVKTGFVEFTGSGIGAIDKAMISKEEKMAILGARLLRAGGVGRDNTAAETSRLEGREETSVLLGAIETTQELYERALRFAASWAAADASAVEVELNNDFVETRMTAPELKELVASWQAEAISRETLHANLQRGEIVPPDRSVDDEVALIRARADELPEPEPEPEPSGGEAA